MVHEVYQVRKSVMNEYRNIKEAYFIRQNGEKFPGRWPTASSGKKAISAKTLYLQRAFKNSPCVVSMFFTHPKTQQGKGQGASKLEIISVDIAPDAWLYKRHIYCQIALTRARHFDAADLPKHLCCVE